MAQVMTSPSLQVDYIDKRRLALSTTQLTNTTRLGPVTFTANGAGTTTTIVGANAAPGTNDVNVIRRGEDVKLFTAAGVPKEETIFKVTTIAVAASTTVTFTPAAAVATASTDFMRLVGQGSMDDIYDLDARLIALDSTTYTQARIDTMTPNDKIYALRTLDDAGSLP